MIYNHIKLKYFRPEINLIFYINESIAVRQNIDMQIFKMLNSMRQNIFKYLSGAN